MRKLLVLALTPLALLVACGGGGGSSFNNTPPPPPTQQIATPGPPNVETLTVDGGPVQSLNTAFITLTVCVHNTNTCVTVDHVEVDTGSSGLRILNEVIPNLPLGILTTSGGMTIAECLPFADGVSFGPVAVADVSFQDSQKTLSAVNIQVIGAQGYTVPSTCLSEGPKVEDTVAAFGANGILGVGPFLQDCGTACEDEATNGITGAYYTCATPATCADASASLDQQVPNPVALFASDNNGVIVELPAVGNAGTSGVTGALVFGIGTQGNNGLGSATVLFEDGSGFISANYKGTTFPQAYIDSGSNINFLDDSTIAVCQDDAQFFCPGSAQNLSAALTGVGGTTVTANFTVADADPFITTPVTLFAVPVLAGPSLDSTHQSFDLGLPYFYGRNFYQAIENQTTPAGAGPYFAF